MLTDSVLKSRHLILVLITLLGLSPGVAAGAQRAARLRPGRPGLADAR